MPPAPLRRSFSSPSVRASPYSSALANSTPGSGRLHGNGNRRASGPATTHRRVLADLEWWRVMDGQQDEQDVDEEGSQGQGPSAAPLGDPSVAPPLGRVSSNSGDVERLHPTQQLAALSLAPQTPRRSSRRHTSMFDSPPSSLESTPEAEESVRFSPLDSDLGYCDLPRFSLALPHPRLALPYPPLPPVSRAHSFDFSALLNESANRFADIGVPSRLPDIFN